MFFFFFSMWWPSLIISSHYSIISFFVLNFWFYSLLREWQVWKSKNQVTYGQLRTKYRCNDKGSYKCVFFFLTLASSCVHSDWKPRHLSGSGLLFRNILMVLSAPRDQTLAWPQRTTSTNKPTQHDKAFEIKGQENMNWDKKIQKSTWTSNFIDQGPYGYW